ncbi:MAG: membrane lipoprotein lipid attachment site-containing protein [Bacteroidaceae bacterium]|nr:membrane lipoprotein lipid attachment site-containing protein [Bacteroidaceae bacterium]
MKKILFVILGLVLLTGCQKGEKIEKPVPDDPSESEITDIPVPELKYRTGGKTHIVSIDSEYEAYDPELKLRSIKLIYSLAQIIQEYTNKDSESSNSYKLSESGDDVAEQIVSLDAQSVVSYLLQLLTTSTLSTAGIHTYTYTYKTVNGKGEPTTAVAALFVPKKGIKIKETPVLVLPGFGIARAMATSISVSAGIDYGMSDLTNLQSLGGIISIMYELLARTGYIVLCPDGLGMGDNYDNHMICTKTSAYPVIDALLACRDIDFGNTDVQWDGKTVTVLGLSESAYTAMEVCKVLQEEYADAFNVVAGACVDGPYDVSESMRNALFNNNDKGNSIMSYAIPVVYSLSDTYGATQPFFSYKNAFRNDIEGIENFPEYINDFYTDPTKNTDLSSTTSFLKKAMPGIYKSAISALSEEYLQTILDPNSFAYKFLQDCNSFDNWMPRMPFMIFQHPADNMIPPSNGERAIEAFRAAGSVTADITYFYETLDLNLGGSSSAGSFLHVGASYVGMFKAFKWIDKQVYGNRLMNLNIKFVD